MHEPGATWNISITFLFGEFLMEYHWRPCIQLVPIFWFTIRPFDAYSSWTFAKLIHNRPFVHEHGATWNISITFLFGEYLMEYHWSPCFQFVPTFWFSNKAFVAYSSAPLLKSFYNWPFVHEQGTTWNISITFLFGEFLMEYHWRPCIQLVPIFWFSIRAFDAYLFWTCAK